MVMPICIKNWEDLKEIESETHTLEVNLNSGTGWLKSKTDKGDRHYMSTHTFYGDMYKHSTRTLQECGFNVQLANWDE